MPKTSWSGQRHHSHATDTDCSRRSRYQQGIIGPNKPKLLYYLTSIKREITEIYREIFILFSYASLIIYLPTTYIFFVGFGGRERIMCARRAGGPRLGYAFWSAHVAIEIPHIACDYLVVVVAVRSSRLVYRGGHNSELSRRYHNMYLYII